MEHIMRTGLRFAVVAAALFGRGSACGAVVPNLDAPTPKTADGKPDLPGRLADCERSAVSERPARPYQPRAAALVKQRVANLSKDDPHARCMRPNFPRLRISA